MFEIGNVTIQARDLEKSIEFYTQILGLKTRLKSPGTWAELEGPGITLGIHPLRDDEHTPVIGDGISLGFHVQDISRARELLRQRGLEFISEPTKDGPVLLAHFADPDGHPLYLCQYL